MHDDHPSVLVDARISERVRLVRRLRGVQRARLGEALGVSHQQVRKYETGESRISGGRLIVIARTLGVPVRAFYEGLDDQPAAAAGAAVPAIPDLLDALPEGGPVPLDDILAVARCMARIEDPAVRRGLLVLAKAIAASAAAAATAAAAVVRTEDGAATAVAIPAANEDSRPDRRPAAPAAARTPPPPPPPAFVERRAAAAAAA